MSYRVALFDLDGTVLDTLDDLAAAVNHALHSEGLPARSRDEVCAFVGNGIGKLIERAVGANCDTAVKERVFTAFKSYYAAHCAVHTKPYDGICELLHKLRAAGIKTALVSNKADFAVQDLAVQYFAGLFDMALGERPEIPRKPAPDMVMHVLHALDAGVEDAVFIGDSDVDVQTAKNAGTAGVFVTWGFRDEQCLRAAGAQCIAHSVSELAELLLTNKKG